MISEATGGAASAGALLRAARESQGMHIAALAAAMKVSQRKLEALEGDRYHELAGASFTRALAQSVCRALRIDAQPVLALLPQPEAVELDHVTGSLNAPFRDRPSRDDPGMAAVTQRSLVWAGLALLVAAVLTYFVPSSWLGSTSGDAPAVAALPASAPAAAAVPVAQPASVPASMPASAPAPMPASVPASMLASMPASSAAAATGPTRPDSPPGPAAQVTALPTVVAGRAPAAVGTAAVGPASAPTAAATGAASGALQFAASDTAWIEVRDAAGRVVLSRTLQRGEVAAVDGVPPLRAVIGNAGAVQVTHRGQPVALTGVSTSNVARLVLN